MHLLAEGQIHPFPQPILVEQLQQEFEQLIGAAVHPYSPSYQHAVRARVALSYARSCHPACQELRRTGSPVDIPRGSGLQPSRR